MVVYGADTLQMNSSFPRYDLWVTARYKGAAKRLAAKALPMEQVQRLAVSYRFSHITIITPSGSRIF